MSTRPPAHLVTPLVALLFVLLAVAAPARADDSPGWRGAAGDGSSAEDGWAEAWPAVKVKAEWERALGAGYSAVAVVGDRVFTMGYQDGKDVVYCLDAKNGRPKWAYGYPARTFTNMNAGGPAGTPWVDRKTVYTLSRDGQLHAFDAKKGKVRWARNLVTDYGVTIPTWGIGGSPVVRDGRVYVDVGVQLALDAKTGGEVWKTRSYGAAYSSPLLFTHDGVDYVAAFPAEGLVVLRRDTGAEVARYAWETNYGVNAATPVWTGDGRLFVSSGYGTGCALVTFDGKTLTEVWRNKKLASHMATAVYVDGHFYGFDDTQLTCIDAASGETKWKQRRIGKGALMLSAGKLVVLGGRGELILADASPAGLEPAFREAVLTGGDAWTMPVLANDRIYCRDPRGRLVCLSVTPGKKVGKGKTKGR